MTSRVFCCFALIAGMAAAATAQQPATSAIAGGRGGTAFGDLNVPGPSRVLEVRVFSGDEVDSVQMIYGLPDGRMLEGPRHGGPGGRLNVFRLDPDEYITGISGRCGIYVDSIRIHTNKRTSPLFGGGGGSQDYRIDVERGSRAVGFIGRSGEFVDAVGLAFVPMMIRREGQTDIAGGRGGSAFSDDEVPPGARISEVRVQSGDHIDAIQAVYTLPDGRALEGAWHGGRGGRLGVFRLDPDEYIVGISGRCGDYVDSLVIETNRRPSPMFGGRGGDRDYRVQIPPRSQVIGFAGRSGEYLDAIGLNFATMVEFQRFEERR